MPHSIFSIIDLALLQAYYYAGMVAWKWAAERLAPEYLPDAQDPLQALFYLNGWPVVVAAAFFMTAAAAKTNEGGDDNDEHEGGV